ncbi:BlaI/MecI/CopY family transcriptional regulator [Adhaeretor mobilis]|uniref:Penicillinase repressor n=1 Tax=Adhaeretor mobilis TaxID=1930276 RepID=A0A517N2G9_9BACT|nr:BlaI/MecI/CopY family transcriptional regulator [Adhaeretor mobilis]QDT01323.1 Penicillinase repressor [Adhaeretor mobilis]
MSRPASEHPTDLELELLKILWDESPLAVRDVRERLAAEAARPLTHSSVITMLNIMHRKGFVKRRKQGKAFLFSPKVEKQSVTGGVVRDVMKKLFNDSPQEMVLNLLETADLDAEELAELRKMINRKAREEKS